jgi:hypothetical protein
VPGPLPDVPSVLEIALKGDWESAIVANVFKLKYSGSAPSNSTCDAIAAHVGDKWDADVMEHLSVNYHVTLTTCTDLTSRTAGSGSSITAHAGGHTESVMPANCALLWHWHSPVRYRGGHPRTYVPGLTADRLDNNQVISDASVTTFDTDQGAFVADVVGFSSGGCTITAFALARIDHAPTPPTLIATYDLEPAGVAKRVCSQRRRLGKVGG